MSYRAVAEPLKKLLPCVYCRNSYVGFYDMMGPPPTRSKTASSSGCAQWVQQIHTLVDTKLASQKLEAVIAAHNWPKSMCDELRASILPTVPTFEVLQKRFAVNREEAISYRSLSTALLAILMYAQEANTDDLREPLQFFCRGLREAVLEADQKNTAALLDLLDCIIDGILKPWATLRASVEYKKYGRKYKGNSQFIKAGICFNGTCA